LMKICLVVQFSRSKIYDFYRFAFSRNALEIAKSIFKMEQQSILLYYS
jgi:hypothetical protein